MGRLIVAVAVLVMQVHRASANAKCKSIPYTSKERYNALSGVGLTVGELCKNHGNAGLNPAAFDTVCAAVSGDYNKCLTARGCAGNTLFTGQQAGDTPNAATNNQVQRCTAADAATCCYNPVFTARAAANPPTQFARADGGTVGAKKAFATASLWNPAVARYGATYAMPIQALDTAKLEAAGGSTAYPGLANHKLVAECGEAFPGQAESCVQASGATAGNCANFGASNYGNGAACTALTGPDGSACVYTPLNKNSLYHTPGPTTGYGVHAPPLQGGSATLWTQWKRTVSDGQICPTLA